jgi:hypothetical protein
VVGPDPLEGGGAYLGRAWFFRPLRQWGLLDDLRISPLQ